jgi:hypothetical protein
MYILKVYIGVENVFGLFLIRLPSCPWTHTTQGHGRPAIEPLSQAFNIFSSMTAVFPLIRKPSISYRKHQISNCEFHKPLYNCGFLLRKWRPVTIPAPINSSVVPRFFKNLFPPVLVKLFLCVAVSGLLCYVAVSDCYVMSQCRTVMLCRSVGLLCRSVGLLCYVALSDCYVMSQCRAVMLCRSVGLLCSKYRA